jgi:hypothetical protein
LRVYQKNPPAVAAPPMVVSLRKRLKMPMLLSFQLTGNKPSRGRTRMDERSGMMWQS